jgi:hypothetical protein
MPKQSKSLLRITSGKVNLLPCEAFFPRLFLGKKAFGQ